MMRTQLRIRSIAKGLATRVPYVDRLANGGAGAKVGAEYFYSVWLRHLVVTRAHAPSMGFDVVGELGPGDALGIAICALLSGAQRYIGLDRLAFALKADNLQLLQELHRLFVARAPIPDDRTLPGLYPKLLDYSFPSHILGEGLLAQSLSEGRVKLIASALRGDMAESSSLLRYAAPWDATRNVEKESVDFLLSQAVMEHVDDIESAYAVMRSWLKPTGYMSHRIDYSCHGITRDWYGHWLVSEAGWRIARGRRAYFINRHTHSTQMDAMSRAGLELVHVDETRSEQVPRQADMQVRHLPSDLAVRGAHVIARRR